MILFALKLWATNFLLHIIVGVVMIFTGQFNAAWVWFGPWFYLSLFSGIFPAALFGIVALWRWKPAP